MSRHAPRPLPGFDRVAPPRPTAQQLLTHGQTIVLVLGVAGVATAAVVSPLTVARTGVAVSVALYLLVLGHRTLLFVRGARTGTSWQVSDDEARDMPDDALPSYTVLVPAYGEPEVLPAVIASLQALEYPRAKLDLRLLLEHDDLDTRAVAERLAPAAGMTVVVVPPGGPRTKPNACNVGLVGARGQLVTIYDAEDHPEPLQLRRAAVAFSRAPRRIACLQARLTYHNATQNTITKWFTSEYDVWFRYLLPGLVASKAPVPLGGTSNHIRRGVLDRVGGWDPWNVTEDADLGVRLHRAGWRTGILDSATEEEANSDFVNWVRQRSRWYKGYLATWLVHHRHPVRLLRQVGWRGWLHLTLFVGGTPLLAALNPVFWALTLVWMVFGANAVQQLFPPVAYHASLLCWVLGATSVVYSALYAAREQRRFSLVPSLLALPAYWVMMSLAASKAVLQLVLSPSYWEKTVHGLSPARESTDVAA